MKQYRPKLGEAVVAIWEKEDGSASGGTEGFVLGVTGDEISGEYLVLDRSTYQDSFKSNILSLNILDLKVIPMEYVERIEKTDMRQRPPGISEDFNMLIEADYKSNIDFNATLVKVEKRNDCEKNRIRRSKSEAEYGIKIKKISTVEGASITISCKGTIQIFCKHEDLDSCIKWIQKVVELLPDHKRLVLFPTKITYGIHDTCKEKSRPTEEVIDRIARADGGAPVILPIGWAHKFFGELDANPLQGFFPGSQPLENFVIKDESKEKKAVKYLPDPSESDSKNSVGLHFPRSGVHATKYLGAVSPIIRLRSIMEDYSPQYEKHLIEAWLGMRSAPWQWFSSDLLKGKMVVRDLNINKTARAWTLDLRKYSSSEAES